MKQTDAAAVQPGLPACCFDLFISGSRSALLDTTDLPLLYTNLRHHIQYLVWISVIPLRTKTSQLPGKTASAGANILNLSFQHQYINVLWCASKSVLPPLWRGILAVSCPVSTFHLSLRLFHLLSSASFNKSMKFLFRWIPLSWAMQFDQFKLLL